MANKVNWNNVVKDNVLEGWLNFKQVLLNIRDQCVPCYHLKNLTSVNGLLVKL